MTQLLILNTFVALQSQFIITSSLAWTDHVTTSASAINCTDYDTPFNHTVTPHSGAAPTLNDPLPHALSSRLEKTFLNHLTINNSIVSNIHIVYSPCASVECNHCKLREDALFYAQDETRSVFISALIPDLMIMLVLTFITSKSPKRVSFNLLILMMVSGVSVSGDVETCDTAYECVGQSRPIDPTNSLHSYGHKANSGGSTHITIDWSNVFSGGSFISCRGAFSCANIGYIRGSAGSSSSKLMCDGAFGCFNTIMNFTGLIDVNCGGANSCDGLTLNAPSVPMNCGGDRSCANAELRTHGAIEARGSYALYNATIHSTADGFYVSLVGSNAGFGARIFCHLGHSCTIYCAATGCKMLYIDCAGNCDIQTNSIDTHHPITDYSLFDALPSNISDSLTIPDDWCDDTIDDFYERPSTIISSVRVCCRGSNSCQESAIKSHLVTVCSGAHSCHGSDEIAAGSIIVCSANNACSNSTLVSIGVYCLGMYACKNAQISASVLFCSGYKSCEGSTIIDTETIHFIGASSGYGAGIDCTGIGSCNIICDAYNSCGYISSFHCNGIGGCTVSCNHDTGCPPGYTPLSVAPTSTEPTSTPSYSPTTSGCIALHPTMKAINVAMSANNITFIHNVPRAEQIDGSDIATFSSQSLYLNVTQSELHCGGLVSCFQSKIYCASEQIHCNVLCKGQLSCIEATIHANNTQNIHVMCDGEDACRNVQIYTHNITAVTIDCVSSSSCTAMQISLNKNTQSIISCYLMNSCDDIHIFSTNYNDTQLYLYEYSENIVYDNGYGLEGIHCGTESQYVRYE
eukprot:990832_1